MTLMGTVGVFTKFVEASSPMIAFIRGAIGVTVMVVIAYCSGHPIDFNRVYRKKNVILASGLMLSCNWIFTFNAYKYGSVAVCTLCMYVYPVVFFLLTICLGRDRFRVRNVLYLALAVLGILLCSGVLFSREFFLDNSIGIFYALSAAILAAVVVYINSRLSDVEPLHSTMCQIFIATLGCCLYLLTTEGVTLFDIPSRSWIFLVAMGVLQTGIAYNLQFSALREVDSISAAVMCYIDPLTATILSFIILKERMDILQAIGAAMILGSTLMCQLSQDGRENQR